MSEINGVPSETVVRSKYSEAQTRLSAKQTGLNEWMSDIKATRYLTRGREASQCYMPFVQLALEAQSSQSFNSTELKALARRNSWCQTENTDGTLGTRSG